MLQQHSKWHFGTLDFGGLVATGGAGGVVTTGAGAGAGAGLSKALTRSLASAPLDMPGTSATALLNNMGSCFLLPMKYSRNGFINAGPSFRPTERTWRIRVSVHGCCMQLARRTLSSSDDGYSGEQSEEEYKQKKQECHIGHIYAKASVRPWAAGVAISLK